MKLLGEFVVWMTGGDDPHPSKIHGLRALDHAKTICGGTPPDHAELVDSAPLHRICHNCLREIMRPYL